MSNRSENNTKSFGRRGPQKSPTTPILGPATSTSSSSSSSSSPSSSPSGTSPKHQQQHENNTEINHESISHHLPSLALSSEYDEKTVLPMYAKSPSRDTGRKSFGSDRSRNSDSSSRNYSPARLKFFAAANGSNYQTNSFLSSLRLRLPFLFKRFRFQKKYSISSIALLLVFLLIPLILCLFFLLFSNNYYNYYFNYYYSRTHGGGGIDDSVANQFTFTNDPLIYPDLLSVFPSSKMSKSSPKKAPGDHAVHMNDPEMVPAAAKKKLNNKDDDSSSSSDPSSDKPGGDANSQKSISNQNIPKLVFQPSSSSFLHNSGSSNNINNNNRHHRNNYPSVVLVMGINPEKYRVEYLERLISNRKRYAEKFGYGLYVRLVTDFKPTYQDSSSGNPSWAKLPIIRAAMQSFPNSKHFWYLDQSAIITDFSTPIEEKLIVPNSLEKVIKRGIPIVENYDVIRTYKYTAVNKMRLIITQDKYGINPISFILANNNNNEKDSNNVLTTNSNALQYSKVLLDLWNDPAYRKYHSFADRSEAAALNHLLLWHPTLLSRVAVVPPRMLAAQSAVDEEKENGGNGNGFRITKQEYEYVKGDTALVLVQCENSSTLACMQEMSEKYV